MTRYDRMSSLFWMGVAMIICIESLRIGPGSLVNPGPGLFPLGAGLGIGFVAAAILILTYKQRDGRNEVFWKPGRARGKVIATVLSILGYALLIDFLGFHLITLFWVGFICWRIGEIGWKGALLTSLISTFYSFLLFERYLGIHFSRGILGF